MQAAQTDSAIPSTPAWLSHSLEALRAFFRGLAIRRRERSLRLCESLPLGEKRLLAVVQFEGRRFLVGATSQSISLLDRLDPAPVGRQKRDSLPESSYLNGVH